MSRRARKWMKPQVEELPLPPSLQAAFAAIESRASTETNDNPKMKDKQKNFYELISWSIQ